MSNTKRIFIIGHSGAGKGVLAQAVAKKLGWKFINADVLGCTAHIGAHFRLQRNLGLMALI